MSLNQALLSSDIEQGEEQAFSSNVVEKKPNGRIHSMDLMRGFIMVIMAWDHCKDMLVSPNDSPKDAGFENWSGSFSTYDNNPWYFFARVISHLCAPGFFFTMGCSIVLFSLSRMEPSKPSSIPWTLKAVIYHFFVRGIVLLIVGRFVDAPFLLGTLTDLYEGRNVTMRGQELHPNMHDKLQTWRNTVVGIFEVMTGLGLTLMLAAAVVLPMMLFIYKRYTFVRPGKPETLFNISITEILGFVLFFTIFATSNILIVNAQGEDPNLTTPWPRSKAKAENLWQLLLRFLVYPGSGYGILGQISYPVIPWLGVTSLGMGFGFVLKRNSKIGHQRALLYAVVFLMSFFIIRSFGGKVGNLRGLPRHDNEDLVSKIQNYLTLCKYPPSLAFAFLTLGIDLVALFVFSRNVFDTVETSKYHIGRPFLVFGRVPLFFYIFHFWAFSSVAVVLRLIYAFKGFKLIALVPIWLTVLYIGYVLCKRYYAFKCTTSPKSLWRML